MTNLRVRIGDNTYFYKSKAPYVPSGFGELGALRIDPAEDRVMCHECGEWFHSLQNHIKYRHGITAVDYKRRHGLIQRVGLIGERLRDRRIEIGRTVVSKLNLVPGIRKGPRPQNTQNRYKSILNARGRCQAQLLYRLHVLGLSLGRTPTATEIDEAGISSKSVALTFGNLPNAMLLAGLAGRRRFERKYADEELLILIIDFHHRHQRWPSGSDCRRGLLPSMHTYRRRFGTWSKAIRLAMATR